MKLFNNPSVFIYMLLAAAAIAVLWYLGFLRADKIRRVLFSAENYNKLIPAELKVRRKIRDISFLSGLFFFFVALATPQWGRIRTEVEASYSQAVLAVDVSLSMNAEDADPSKYSIPQAARSSMAFKSLSRINMAKKMLQMLIDNFTTERVGIIAFTSQAYMQSPITTDISALKTLAKGLRVNMIPARGTALAPAVVLASKMLAPYPGTKALVLITDGEDHKPEDLQSALKTARDNEIKIIAVGIGNPEGSLIPERGGGNALTALTKNGRITGYKKDKEGKTVLSKLDENSLINLASATGGAYIRFTTAQQTAEEIYRQMSMLDKSTSLVNGNILYVNRYQIPLFIGFVLVLCSILIPLRKVK